MSLAEAVSQGHFLVLHDSLFQPCLLYPHFLSPVDLASPLSVQIMFVCMSGCARSLHAVGLFAMPCSYIPLLQAYFAVRFLGQQLSLGAPPGTRCSR